MLKKPTKFTHSNMRGHDMLHQLIDGFYARMQVALEQKDYEELSCLDAAFSQMMRENPLSGLSHSGLSHSDLAQGDNASSESTGDCGDPKAIYDSLQKIAELYKSAVTLCLEERERLKHELNSIGRAHRNTDAYLTVAGNSL